MVVETAVLRITLERVRYGEDSPQEGVGVGALLACKPGKTRESQARRGVLRTVRRDSRILMVVSFCDGLGRIARGRRAFWGGHCSAPFRPPGEPHPHPAPPVATHPEGPHPRP